MSVLIVAYSWCTLISSPRFGKPVMILLSIRLLLAIRWSKMTRGERWLIDWKYVHLIGVRKDSLIALMAFPQTPQPRLKLIFSYPDTGLKLVAV